MADIYTLQVAFGFYVYASCAAETIILEEGHNIKKQGTIKSVVYASVRTGLLLPQLLILFQPYVIINCVG